MRKSLLILAVALGLIAPAAAQVNVVPQIGVASGIVKQATYSAVSIGLVPASSATDIFCISGSTTKSISVKKIDITGVAGTLISAPFTLLHRVTLDSDGTAASTTANPANTLGANNPTDPAASATLIAYTANPTINDTSPTYMRTEYLTLPTTAAGTTTTPLSWLAGEQIGWFSRAFDIPKGVVGQFCVNLNGTSVSSGVLDISITWTEQ